MNKLLLGVSAAALMLGVTPVFAADLMHEAAPVAAPAMEAFNGFYAGVSLGYVNTRGQIDDVNPNYADTAGFQDVVAANGFLLGGQIGYDFRLDSNFVVGIGADAKGIFSEDAACGASGCVDYNTDGPALSYNITGLGAITAKAGMVVGDNTLLYVLAGGAAGSVVTNHWDDSQYDGSTRMFTGYVLGLGAEMMVTDNASVGIEGRYYDLGQKMYTNTGEDFGAHPTAFTASLTTNFHF